MNVSTETDRHVGGKDFLGSFQLPFICDNNSIPFVYFQVSEGITCLPLELLLMFLIRQQLDITAREQE